MAVFSLEQGMPTSTCPTIWALRMRVSMSEIGSVMLIARSSPARLDDARHFAAHRQLAQLGPAQAELAVYAARPAGQGAAVAQPGGRGVARQLLQTHARRLLVLVRRPGVVEHLEQRGTLRLEFLDRLATLLFAELHCELGHGFSLSELGLAWVLASGPAGTGNGTRRAARAPRCRSWPWW